MVHEQLVVSPAKTFDIWIAPNPIAGAKSPVVIVLHGNAGLTMGFEGQLKDFTDQIAAAGHVAALASYYPSGGSNLDDDNPAQHVPVLEAAIDHLGRRTDTDMSRIGLAGFSLGGGVAATYLARNRSTHHVKAFADFYGYVAPVLTATSNDVSRFPPTILFHYQGDRLRADKNSEPFADALAAARIEHKPDTKPYQWYSGNGHAFPKGSSEDTQSRAEAVQWFKDHL